LSFKGVKRFLWGYLTSNGRGTLMECDDGVTNGFIEALRANAEKGAENSRVLLVAL